MRAGARGTTALFLTLILAATLSPSRVGAQSVPPDDRWLAFETSHFNVSFLDGLEPIARRAASRAEWAYELLSREFVSPPEGRIELVVADNVDFSNGLATPFPRNRVIVYAQPPAGEPTLAYSDDWLQLLMLHELVHIFHLDDAGSIWQPLRSVFGRDPTLFPQIFSPGWVVEGLATYFETEHTTGGRARGAIYDMILRAAILEGGFFGIDQVTLDPVSWPSSATRYVYGALFIDHLATRFGPARITEYVRRVGRQLIPYRSDAAARGTFGTTLTREWNVWADSLRIRYTALADSLEAEGLTVPTLLTTEGRFAQYPRFSPDGSRLVYSANTGRDDPGHVILSIEGDRIDAERRSALGPGAWIEETDEMLFAQLDFDGPYHLYSDLYIEDAGGRTRRVTDEARVWDADPRPGDRTAVAVQSAAGANVLVLVDLESGELSRLTEPSFDQYWSSPRWSPSGDRIAAGVWRAGGRFDVIVLDAAGAIVREITADPFIDSDPVWSPDERYILFASDRNGIPNLFARDLTSDRLWQVTNVLTGAFQPDISSDGQWIGFSYYLSDGYHIARIPYDPGSWREIDEPGDSSPQPAAFPEGSSSDEPPPRDYSPLPSVLPTYWTVVLTGGEDLGLGVAIAGEDVIERHSWDAEVVGFPADRRFSSGARYRYRGWGNPALELAAGQGWRVESRANGSFGGDLLRREREGAATLTWLRRRWNSSTSLQLGADLSDTDFFRRANLRSAEREIPRDFGASIGVGYSTIRGFGLSLGPQEGILASARIQARRYLDRPDETPSRQDFLRLTTRARAFRGIDWFGFAPPTLAARFDAGLESHTAGAGFSLGGAGGQGAGLPIQPEFLGGSIAYPVRGFPPGAQRGNRIFSASAEYRFPIALIERGFRLFPLALNRLSGDLFVDAGAAWCDGSCAVPTPHTPSSPDPLLSVGAEAIITLRARYLVNLPLRAGVAFPVTDGSPSVYVRIGAGF